MTYGDDRVNTRVDWIEIEQRVRAGESARAISRDLTSAGRKISHTAINKHCRRGGWRLPDNVDETTAAPEPTTTRCQRAAAKVLGVGQATVVRDLADEPSGSPSYFDTDPHQAGKTGKAAANHASTRHLDGDTTAGATQELPTEKTSAITTQKKKKARPPRRRTLWALQRDGTTRVVGFYDKGV